MTSLLHVVGARPNFMKAAPVLRAGAAHGFEQVLVHTGQHYDAAMSDSFFTDLELPQPNENLGVGSGTHAEQTARIMLGFEPVLDRCWRNLDWRHRRGSGSWNRWGIWRRLAWFERRRWC